MIVLTKVVSYRIFNPANSIFKSSQSQKATFTKTLCNNSDNCDAFKAGTCSMERFSKSERCPYGHNEKETGFTKRASNYQKWIDERFDSVKGVKQLDACNKICEIGEYVHFPYPHWTLDKSIPATRRSGLLSGGQEFVHKKLFTTDFFQKIILSRPQAIMGGEIISYQKEVVPKIINHTRKEMPDFFKKWALKYPKTANDFKEMNYIGRKAFIKTLPAGTIIPYKGEKMKEIIQSLKLLILEVAEVQTGEACKARRDKLSVVAFKMGEMLKKFKAMQNLKSDIRKPTDLIIKIKQMGITFAELKTHLFGGGAPTEYLKRIMNDFESEFKSILTELNRLRSTKVETRYRIRMKDGPVIPASNYSEFPTLKPAAKDCDLEYARNHIRECHAKHHFQDVPFVIERVTTEIVETVE